MNGTVRSISRPAIAIPLVVLGVAGLAVGGLWYARRDSAALAAPATSGAKDELTKSVGTSAASKSDATSDASASDTKDATPSATPSTSAATPFANPGGHAAALPAFKLEDPAGTSHERDALLAKGGIIIVVTAPTLSLGDGQEAWNEALAATAPANGQWILLEDVSQSSFPGTALGRMKDEFVPAHPPLLLLDLDGALRTALGVAEDATIVLAYDERGVLTHADAGDASEAGARKAWSALATAE